MKMLAEQNDLSLMLAKGNREYGISGLPANENAEIELRNKYHDLPPASTREGYEAHRIAIAELVKTRTAVEKRRKELKAEYLEAGRRIDSFAKYITEIIENIEKPIRDAKAIVDDAKERERRAKEEAARAKRDEEERQRLAIEQARLKAEREAEEARLKAIRDAENERLRAEKERLDAERAKLLAEQKSAEDASRIEREKMEAERAELERQRKAIADEQRKIATAQEAERKRIEQVELDRLAKIKAEQDERDRLERQRAESERAAIAKADEDKKEAELLHAMRFDVEKVHLYATLFRTISPPPTDLQSYVAKKVCKQAYDAIVAAINMLELFKVK